MTAEQRPEWKVRAQDLLGPKWGANSSLTLMEYFNKPVFGDFGRPHVESFLRTTKNNVADVQTRSDRIANRTHPVKVDAHEARVPYYERAAVLFYRMMEVVCPDRQIQVEDMRTVVEAISVIPQFMVWKSDNPLPSADVDNVFLASTQMAAGLITLFLDPEFTPTEVPSDEDAIDHYFRTLIMKRALDNDILEESCPATPREIKDGLRGLSLIPDKLNLTQDDDLLFEAILESSTLERLKKLGKADTAIMEMRLRGRARNRPSSKEKIETVFSGISEINEALGREKPTLSTILSDIVLLF